MLTAPEPEVAAEGRPLLATLRPETSPISPGDGNASAFPLFRLHTAAYFGVSVLLIVVAIALGTLSVVLPVSGALWLGGAVLLAFATLLAICRAAHAFVRLVRPAQARPTARVDTAIDILGNLFMAGFGMLVAYLTTVGFSRGRQLRRFGRVLLPRLESSPAWAQSTVVLDSSERPPSGVAEQWRENGKTEHASVAAFARLTLDLMALGAPPSLIAGANRDALDEIRHAELCFSIASALDGNSVSPGPFPQAQSIPTLPRSRILALAKLAVDSLVDGALHEGVSARIIAKLAHRCEIPAIRTALKEIAADEGRHAAHGWVVVEWCLDEGGLPVEQALLGAIRALPRQMHSQLPQSASDGGWERWGIHGHSLESDEYTAALAHLVDRVRARVAARGAAA